MATLVIAVGAIWLVVALVFVLALCGAAARPLPKFDPDAPIVECHDEEDITVPSPLVSQPAALR